MSDDRSIHIEHHPAPPGMAPGTGYSHAVAATGRVVAIAGQVALDADGNLVGPGDPRAQAEQVFENLRLALAAAGATFADVVKLNFYATDLSMLPEVRDVRDRYVDTANPPASTAVQVVALFRPELLLEVEAWAVIPSASGERGTSAPDQTRAGEVPATNTR
jgi:enamine deaminase RidA (YjgF/YER057c/UK114 family)